MRRSLATCGVMVIPWSGLEVDTGGGLRKEMYQYILICIMWRTKGNWKFVPRGSYLLFVYRFGPSSIRSLFHTFVLFTHIPQQWYPDGISRLWFVLGWWGRTRSSKIGHSCKEVRLVPRVIPPNAYRTDINWLCLGKRNCPFYLRISTPVSYIGTWKPK